MTKAREVLTHVGQGEFAVSDDPAAVMTTVLGSCVAVTLHDPERRIGGLNHFLLPEGSGERGDMSFFGINAMELLINALLKKGASKARLQAKLFGGAQVVRGLSGIGRRNADFARKFLRDERIVCLAESLGGTQARRIRFWPVDNRARQLLITDSALVPPAPPPPVLTEGNDVELF